MVKPTTAPSVATGSPFSLKVKSPRKHPVQSVANMASMTPGRLPSDAAIASSMTVAACAP